MFIRCLSLCALFVGAAVQTASADPVADFYHGKTVSIVVGSSPGGGYDALARLVAPYLSKHIPGNPSVIVRNMPGAGGIVATRYIADVAPRDGLTIGCVLANTPFEPLLGTKEATYDPTKLTWLGTPSVETGLLAVWYTSKVKTLDDAKKIPISAGVTGTHSEPALYARLLNQLLGLKIKVIPGFPGQNDAYLAMERGELDTVGTILWSSLAATKSEWIKDNKIRILLQYGPEKEAALPNVPYGPDLVSSPDDKLLFEAAYAPLSVGRPFVAPPELPADRAAALQSAVLAAFKDPAFVAEAKKHRFEVNKPTSGEALRARIAHVYQMPQRIVTRLRKIAQDY